MTIDRRGNVILFVQRLLTIIVCILFVFGCASNGNLEKPASPPGYESDTTPEHDGEDWKGGK